MTVEAVGKSVSHTHSHKENRRFRRCQAFKPAALTQLGEHRGGMVVVVVGSKMQLEGGMKGCKVGWGRVETGRWVTSRGAGGRNLTGYKEATEQQS